MAEQRDELMARLLTGELDPESALRVTAFRGGTVLRTVELGKEARTYQHTYVKVEGDRRVYQAEGDLGNYFPIVGDVLRAFG